MDYLHDSYFANLNAVCRSGEHYVHPPEHIWSIHEYAFSQNKFYYFLNGSCRITVNGTAYTAKGGDWFFIPAGARHSYSHIPGETFEKYWLHFDLYPNSKLAAMLQLPCMIHVGNDRRVSSLFRALSEANNSDRLTDRLRAKACLLQLLALYVELCDLGSIRISGEESSTIQEVLKYIHTNLSCPISNRELAELCHMHPNHFIRYFSRMTGQTPAAYVCERRMEAAKRLLENTELSIAQVMEQIGLHEPGHFARLFRKFYSITPRDYRNRISQNCPGSDKSRNLLQEK